MSGSVPAQPMAPESYHGTSGIMYARTCDRRPLGAGTNAGWPSGRCRLVAESRSAAIGSDPATCMPPGPRGAPVAAPCRCVTKVQELHPVRGKNSIVRGKFFLEVLFKPLGPASREA